MNSTFFGFELARRALATQQSALEIAGHNISNSNTPGYTRQVAVLAATTPQQIPSVGKQVSIGTGVNLDSVVRARDAFIDKQYRSETSSYEYWSNREKSLTKIQNVFNEPSDDSLSNDLVNFWSAWSDLSKSPENEGARSVVRERANIVVDSFHAIANQISDMTDLMDNEVTVKINQINTLASQIAALNDKIKHAEVAGAAPNDMYDKRDQLVDELAEIVNVKVIESRDMSFTDRVVNNYKIVIGDESDPNNVLVDNSMANSLQDPPPTDANGLALVKWTAGSDLTLVGKQGSLQASLEMRDQYLPELMNQMNALAQGVADGVNALHRTGQGLVHETQALGPGGIDFFIDGDQTYPGTYSTPADLPNTITAANITINFEILGDLQRIATGALDSTAISEGDGTVSQKISSLASGWTPLKSFMTAGLFGAADESPVSGSSFSDFYSSNVAQMGVDVQQATRMKEGQNVLVTSLYNQRESSVGVSLDEEMSNIIQFQKSYSAAARVMTVLDEMLDKMLNMGLTK